MNNYFDFYKSMIDNQKNIMENFKSFGPQFPQFPQFPQSFSPMDYMKGYETFMKSQQSMFDQTKKMWEGMGNFASATPLDAWQKAMEVMNPLNLSKSMGLEESKVFEKVLNANKLYLSMYNFYEDLKNTYVNPAQEEMNKIVEDSIVNFDNMFRETMMPLLPAELRPFVENPYNFSKTVVEITSNFFAPWKDSYPEMTEMLMKAPMSREQLIEYIKLWKSNYNSTIGALMKSPVVGSNRELIEQQNRAVDAAVDMLLTTVEFLGKIATVANSQGKVSIEDWLKQSQENAEPKSFKEFYNFWTGKIEEELEKFFYTDEYGQLVGKTLDANMKFKIETNKLAEQYLSRTPIVTHGQIDSLYKTVYELKKQVKSLKKELAATKEVKKEEVKK